MAPWSRLTSPIYKNTGSVARDHLASERTYLAWTRTGLGFVALGMGVERFSRFEAIALGNGSSSSSSSSKPQTPDEQQQEGGGHGKEEALGSRLLVGTLLTLGTGCMVYATRRYFSVLRSLEKGEFRPAYQGIAAMGAVLGALGGGVSTRMTGAWFESEEPAAKE
ncbi:hypothetical protein BM221_003250 [Beauveria bassiana]|uniref:DUF202 domain-containing protein n=1 Tax=Beauveria bassiana TaxID=176275 RepID=A0A2N6NU46_BEABA|nr:hypothetical protein BM221_003250 [Beauveria bassiana]